MCHRIKSSSSSSSPSSHGTISMPTTTGDSDQRPSSARRSRTKTRKPKFLSLLRLEDMTGDTDRPCRVRGPRRQQPQLDLFPLHPETAASDGLVDFDSKNEQPQAELENVNVNFLFNGDDDTSATTLSGLLDRRGDDRAAVPCSEEGSVGSHGDSIRGLRESMDAGGEDDRRRSSLLVRVAMKSGWRPEGNDQEKWVSYSEVVERKPPANQEAEEVMSSCSGSAAATTWQPNGEAAERSGSGLLLKLDYKEVLNSWPSDKGPLFINHDQNDVVRVHHHHCETAQIVPEINGGFLGPETAVSNGQQNLWVVPDHNESFITMSDEKEGCRFRQIREASVLRYKEKRQNRLFAKRIRYEVRKLNAEKRPRIKGRFVRRSSGDD